MLLDFNILAPCKTLANEMLASKKNRYEGVPENILGSFGSCMLGNHKNTVNLIFKPLSLQQWAESRPINFWRGYNSIFIRPLQ